MREEDEEGGFKENWSDNTNHSDVGPQTADSGPPEGVTDRHHNIIIMAHNYLHGYV